MLGNSTFEKCFELFADEVGYLSPFLLSLSQERREVLLEHSEKHRLSRIARTIDCRGPDDHAVSPKQETGQSYAYQPKT